MTKKLIKNQWECLYCGDLSMIKDACVYVEVDGG